MKKTKLLKEGKRGKKTNLTITVINKIAKPKLPKKLFAHDKA